MGPASAQTALHRTPHPRAEGEKAPEFELPDQWHNRHTVRFPYDRVTLVVIADPKGAESIVDWYKVLEPYQPKVRLKGVGQISRVPRLLQRFAIRFLRKRVDFPVLLDWGGKVARAYRFRRNNTNIIVVDPKGVVVKRFIGPPTDERVKAFRITMKKLINAPARTDEPA